MLSRSLQSGWEGLVEDGISGPMEKHPGPDAFQMIDWIGHPIVTLQLRDLGVSRKRHLHDFGIERWVIIKPSCGIEER